MKFKKIALKCQNLRGLWVKSLSSPVFQIKIILQRVSDELQRGCFSGSAPVFEQGGLL